MRPLTHNSVKVNASHRSRHALRARALGLAQASLAALKLLGCGGGPASVISPPPSAPPPPSVTVTVSPTTGSVLLGNSQTLTATVTSTTDTSVTWSVNNIPGGGPSMGTITAAGVYTAPVDLPSPATVRVTATSQADSTESATAQLTITSDIGISIAPPNASVELGAVQAFHAAITSAGHPDTSVRWSLSGCLPHSVRQRGPERQLHGTRNSSISHNRDTHGAECGRSIQASFDRRQHHQQFHASSYRPTKRACRRRSNDRRHNDSRRGFQSQHGSIVVTLWSRLQFHNVRDADSSDHARIRWNSHRRYRNLHGSKHAA